jgi:XapX domain-containing protein
MSAQTMAGHFVSLVMGLAVGMAYGLAQVRSPAPPLIALVGLLGILIGEQAADVVKRHLAPPPAHAEVRSPAGNDREPS